MDPELIAELKRLDALMNVPKPIPEYRWYFDEKGKIIHCTSLDHLPGDNYIVVSELIYNNYNDYTVKNNQPIKRPRDWGILKFGLIKSTDGQSVVKNHASLVIEDHEDYKQIEYYDARTN